MYLTHTKTMMAEGLRRTFSDAYLNPDFRSVPVSIEYPETPQDYPGIWVDFEPLGEMEWAGVGHAEYEVLSSGGARRFTRWRFQGYATFTCVAMTSRERDALFDEVVRIFAFGQEHHTTQPFRRAIEDNPLIALNMDFGTIGQRGFAASPGTPWQTDEMIYEATLSMNVIGEFVADKVEGILVPISQFLVTDLADAQVDPDPWDQR